MNYSSKLTEAERTFVVDFGLITTASRIAPQLDCREADAVIGMFWQAGAIATAQIWAARHADADGWDKKHHCQRLHRGEQGQMVWFLSPAANGTDEWRQNPTAAEIAGWGMTSLALDEV